MLTEQKSMLRSLIWVDLQNTSHRISDSWAFCHMHHAEMDFSVANMPIKARPRGTAIFTKLSVTPLSLHKQIWGLFKQSLRQSILKMSFLSPHPQSSTYQGMFFNSATLTLSQKQVCCFSDELDLIWHYSSNVWFGICTFSSNFLSAYTFIHCSFAERIFSKEREFAFLPVHLQGVRELEGIQNTAFSSRQAHTHDSNLLALNLEASAATLDHRIWKHAIEEASRRQGSYTCSPDCSVAQSPTVSSSHQCSTSVCRWLSNLRQWRKKENEVSLVLVKREQWGEGSRAEGCSYEMIHSGQETDAWQRGQQCRSLLLLSCALKSRTRYVTSLWVRLLTSEDEYVQYQSILSYFSISPPNRAGFAPFSWCLCYSTQQ